MQTAFLIHEYPRKPGITGFLNTSYNLQILGEGPFVYSERKAPRWLDHQLIYADEKTGEVDWQSYFHPEYQWIYGFGLQNMKWRKRFVSEVLDLLVETGNQRSTEEFQAYDQKFQEWMKRCGDPLVIKS
jgi:hypothetical protein